MESKDSPSEATRAPALRPNSDASTAAADVVGDEIQDLVSVMGRGRGNKKKKKSSQPSNASSSRLSSSSSSSLPPVIVADINTRVPPRIPLHANTDFEKMSHQAKSCDMLMFIIEYWLIFTLFWEHVTDMSKDGEEDAVVARLLAIEFVNAFLKVSGGRKHQSYLHMMRWST